MTKREARRIALRLAYEAVQRALQVGGDEAQDIKEQPLVEDALDRIAQELYERSVRAGCDFVNPLRTLGEQEPIR